ncbi:type VI secretion system tip protein TssI/VgrG [uncultured Tateyamaria sp.]|uniref:type VI secretion system Vgr family protein n=1 Tax=Tateyamaria sp. 1078 TaxID=3417464 RepID=UPI00260C2063|nr:type VI secretion system tip protein TssI/VgrG [uncultured Tateyamaria sp.]
MNAHFGQAGRQGRLETALGRDALVLLRMDGTEKMSGDFEWTVEALSEDAEIDLHALLGTHATVLIDHASGTRAFDGIVAEAQARGTDENGFRYDLTLRPWLHVAGLRLNMRIFHNQTVIQIVEAVLGDYAGLGSPHLDVQVTGDYPTLEYTVQYGDSDADFVRRQLERHGISWSWRHEAGNHTLLLTDAAFSLPTVPGGSRPFYRIAGFHQHDEEHFSRWSPGQRMTTGAVRLTEYNFKIPTAAQEVDQTGDATHPAGDIESYDWPGDYLEQGQGRGVVGTRVDAERGQAPRHEAAGDVVSLGAGWRVTLGGDEVADATGRGFVCLKATHRFRAQAYGSGEAGGDEAPYAGAYVLMPDDTPYRPEQCTKGPRVQGPETAVVVGEGEIDCDEYGRILCRFHWDLEGAHTMRVRVSQNWASKGWGGMVIPRIGMEVIVEHLRGDPDKPIVTGCVFNGKNDAPYPLPEHKTKSVFRTDTHKGDGFNELTFEDEKGQEKIYLHAEKDHELHIENNRSKRVDRNQSESVGNNKSIEIGNNHQEVIGGNMTLMVGPNKLQNAVTSAFSKFTNAIGDMANNLGLPDILNMGEGNLVIGVGKNKAETVMVSSTEVVGAGKAVTVGGGYQVVVGGIQNTSVGIGAIEEVGHNKSIVVGKVFEIIVGESKLVMTEDGKIDISGVDITINGKSSIAAKAGRIDLN